MDLVNLIENNRFLGNEFLTWLWFKSDLFEGRFAIGEYRACEVWFDDSITLEAVIAETEQSVLKGASPTFTPEAREALRQGKLPTQAKIRVICDGQEFLFVFKAAAFALSGIKLPALMTKADDEKFYERMFLLELLEALVDNLYGEFLGLRLHGEVWGTITQSIRSWVQDNPTLDMDTYKELRVKAPPLTLAKRSISVADLPRTEVARTAGGAPVATSSDCETATNEAAADHAGETTNTAEPAAQLRRQPAPETAPAAGETAPAAAEPVAAAETVPVPPPAEAPSEQPTAP